MTDFQRCLMAAMGSAYQKKAESLLIALQPTGEALVLLFALEVLLWTA